MGGDWPLAAATEAAAAVAAAVGPVGDADASKESGYLSKLRVSSGALTVGTHGATIEQL